MDEKNNAIEKVEQIANANLQNGVGKDVQMENYQENNSYDDQLNDHDVLQTDRIYQTGEVQNHYDGEQMHDEKISQEVQDSQRLENARSVLEEYSVEGENFQIPDENAVSQSKKETKRLKKLKSKAQNLREKHLKDEQKAQNKRAKKREMERIKREKSQTKELKESFGGNGGKGGNGGHHGGADRSNGKKNGWLTAVISLSVATLGLATAMTCFLIMPSASEKALESAYRQSFYDTVEQVDNIDLNLSKALSTKDSSALMKYLVNTAINSEVAESDIQSLPLQDENKFYTTKLINQIGDYSKYLNNKLARGEGLSQADYDGLSQLYKANLQFKESLQLIIRNMGEDFNFSSMGESGNGNVVIGNFNDLQNLSVEYPELIYDGPFSDGQTDREIKGLHGEEITAKRAKDIFLSIFSSYQIDAIETAGETGGKIDCYNLSASSNGDLIYGQISKVGGKLIMFSYAGECNAVNYSEEYAQDKAIEFLNEVGATSMKPVWINLAQNVYTINCAYEQNGIIVYSDLIKVRVCADSGNVIGMEASGYYTNHTDRVIGSAVLSERQALAKVSDTIKVQTVRLALVPDGQNAERLCYEFSGTSEGRTYYVYIDSVTGRQVEMFKVIESTEGTLLM